MNKFIVIILTIFFLYSCEKEIRGYNVDLIIPFQVVDKSGKDLLSNVNESSVNVFHLESGKIERFYADHLDHPKGISITKTDKSYILNFYICNDTTLINWFDTTDTIVVNYVVEKYSKTWDKSWINGVLYTIDDRSREPFRLVK